MPRNGAEPAHPRRERSPTAASRTPPNRPCRKARWRATFEHATNLCTDRKGSPLRIPVIGAGAVGGCFGARLTPAGRDVTFPIRRSTTECEPVVAAAGDPVTDAEHQAARAHQHEVPTPVLDLALVQLRAAAPAATA